MSEPGGGIHPDFRDRTVVWRMGVYDADVFGGYLISAGAGRDLVYKDGEALVAAAHALNGGRCPDRGHPCDEPV